MLAESNNILQMKTTFKKINPRNKLGVSTHSRYKSTNYNYSNYQRLQHSREDYKISPQGRQILFMFVERDATKHLNVKGKEFFFFFFFQNIRTYFKGQTYFFTLGYDIVSSNLFVDCGAAEHVITDNFEPGNHFVEIADGS